MEKAYLIGTRKGHLWFLLLAALLTSLLLNNPGSAATWRAFQSPISPISPISPVVAPSEPAAKPAAGPTAAPAIPTSSASTPVLWIVIGLVVVGAFVVGLVFFQKRRAEGGE